MSDTVDGTWPPPQSIWDGRYLGPDYFYGTAPNAFLVREAGRLAQGERILSIADGEGRNSVWLAGQHHRVTAFESSMPAVEKARRLAAERGAVLGMHLSTCEDWDWEAPPYDAVVAIFIQFHAPRERAWMFAQLARAVRPGGLLFLHGYAPRQVDYGSGGPTNPDALYTPELLRESFPGWEIQRLDDYDAFLDEGEGHHGMSALIDFVARRPL